MAEPLALPPGVDAPAAARIWQALGEGIPASIDFSAVREIDSAGLALVWALHRRAMAANRLMPLIGVPARFAQLCAAHRIDRELLP